MDQGKGQGFSLDREEKQDTERRRNDRAWVAIVAKILLVPFLLFFSLVVGLMIGYGVIGKMPISEVFDVNTYKHMYDLIFARV